MPPDGRMYFTVPSAVDTEGPFTESDNDSTAGKPWFCTLFEAVADLDLRQKIDIEFWTIVDNEALLSRPFALGVIEAKRLPESDTCLWKGSDEKPPARGRPSRKRQQKTESDAAEGVAGSSSDDDKAGPADSASAASSSSSSSSSETSDGSDGDEAGSVWQLLQAAGERWPESEGEAPQAPDQGDERSAAGSATTSSTSSDSSDSCSDTDTNMASDSTSTSRDTVAAGAAPASSCNGREARVGRQAARGLSVFQGGHLVAEDCIKYNPATDNFYATCKNLHHGRCVASRSAHEGRKPAQGRPLGFLAAWIAKGDSCSDQVQHKKLQPSQADRLAARCDLAKPEQADLLPEFLAKERPRRADEAEEPEGCP